MYLTYWIVFGLYGLYCGRYGFLFFFFFKQKTAYEMRISDWSSDVCSSDLTLERLVDFDRLNAGDVRVSVGAVNVRSGNLVYFDSAERRLRAEHFMASGALPPGFPAVEIDGEYYWDGGMVSNTPLSRVLNSEPRRDTLTLDRKSTRLNSSH